MLILTLLICFIVSVSMTPIVKKLAFKIGAVDAPNARKVHQKIMPRLGGFAIYIAFIIGFLLTRPESQMVSVTAILIGSFIIVITGILDDVYQLSPKVKLMGQIIAALVVIFGGVKIEYINLPFDGVLNFGWFSIPLTLLWIVGITNAINLIDGLDGLAAGVSSIVLITITILAMLDGNIFVMTLGTILIGSTLGFLVHNFHPAKIFMGDTGALFLGYIISVISILGFKNVTLFSIIVPAIILAVPISDTFFAIIRRVVNKRPLSSPDKSHLHHCLLRLGFSHTKTVLIIYGISAFFGLAAVILTLSTLWVSLVILLVLMIAIELIVELVGLVNTNYRPILNFLGRLSK